MKKTRASSLSLLALVAFACSGNKSAAGTYELDKAAFKQAMLDLAATNAKGNKDAMAAVEKMIGEMADAMNVTAELKADGTYTTTTKGEAMGQKLDQVESGTWKLDGNKLTITTKGKDGKEESHTADYANG